MIDKLEKAKEILTLLQEDTITPSQIKILIAYLVELSQEKKKELFSEFKLLLDNISQETYHKIQETLFVINEKAHDNQLEVRQLTNKQQKAHDKQLSELRDIVTELKSIKYKDGKDGIDGIDGKDADEEVIVNKVLERIVLPEFIHDDGEQIVSKINDLPTNDEDLKIDASHIKNLPKIKDGNFIYGNSSGIKELVGGTNITIDNTNLGYPVISATGGLSESFETVSKNLKAYPYTITYASGDIDTIVYDLGGGMQITKTFGYTSGDVTSITLSDDTPGGIDLIKTISYVGGAVDNVVYS